MTIDSLRQRIIANTLLATLSNRYDAHKYMCEMLTDGMRICVKKIEQFVEKGATKDQYNEVADSWRKCAEAAASLEKSTPRDKGCQIATVKMAITIIALADEVKGLPEKIPFHNIPLATEKSEYEIKQEEVDRILDKISAQGINFLTQQEKDTLSNFQQP